KTGRDMEGSWGNCDSQAADRTRSGNNPTAKKYTAMSANGTVTYGPGDRSCTTAASASTAHIVKIAMLNNRQCCTRKGWRNFTGAKLRPASTKIATAASHPGGSSRYR